MAEEQLRKALALFKEGNKPEAAKIARSILQSDKNNVGAWWMMANVLEDEDKQVRALERVLKIKPDHKGAKTKLAKMRPEDVDDLPNVMETQEMLNLDWSKLGDAAHPDKRKTVSDDDHHVARMAMLGLGAFVALIIILTVGFMVYTSELVQGPSPEKVTTQYLAAFTSLDFDKLSALSCAADRQALTGRQQRMSGQLTAMGFGTDFVIDFSETTMDVLNEEDTTVDVQLSGTVSVTANGETQAVEISQLSALLGGDLLMPLAREDGIWRVCEAR